MQAASPDAKSQGLPDFKDSSHQNDVASHFELLSESVIHQRCSTDTFVRTTAPHPAGVQHAVPLRLQPFAVIRRIALESPPFIA